MIGKQNKTRYNLLNTETVVTRQIYSTFAASVFPEKPVKTKQAIQTKYLKIITKYMHVHV